tara:strand:+ start:55 stop:282 length:228 start_codon:yes stop_codon:yes gene_type:complete
MINVDAFIKLGFWSQLVLLFLVDMGTVMAFMKEPVPWYHYVGFCVVNAALLYITYRTWGWLRHQRTSDIDAPDID